MTPQSHLPTSLTAYALSSVTFPCEQSLHFDGFWSHTPSDPVKDNTVEKGRTQGFVARDDKRGEIAVSFRGTFNLKDAVTDARAWLTPFDLPGIAKDPKIRVHKGFLLPYKDVSDDVRTIVKNELKSFPTYRIVVTGHSLGGAIASIAALSLKTEFPHTTLQLDTFGQPRVGTKNFARHVENTIGVENIFRAVHNLDGVPMVPRIAYEHFATEYWQS
ncbi:Alpha/Beta hydrolase protein, partial [Mycena leptocephala]